MSEQLELEVEDTRLSYSSASLLKNCEQRYHFYKVENAKIDKDAAARDNSHFAIGKAFHYVLETSMHEKPKSIMKDLEHCIQDAEINLNEEDAGLVHALVLKYLRQRKGSRLKAVGCEYEISHPSIIGYVDLIEVDEITGEFWISDLKTATNFYDSKIAELPSNDQLNLYASFYKDIAKHYGLDPKKFKGCRYLVACKSKAKQRASESYVEFVSRLVEKHIKVVFVTIPKELMRIEAAKKEHLALYKKSMKLREGKSKPTRNYSYCNAYFKSCDFFSRCHGAEYSDIMAEAKIIVERS